MVAGTSVLRDTRPRDIGRASCLASRGSRVRTRAADWAWRARPAAQAPHRAYCNMGRTGHGARFELTLRKERESSLDPLSRQRPACKSGYGSQAQSLQPQSIHRPRKSE